MDYQESLDYMLDQLPMYQRVGKAAFKKDLTNTLALCEALGNPQNSFPSIHIAGTNGKGSSAHLLQYILKSAGYKTGMYTSPHLKSFTERIRVNGIDVEKSFVADFITEQRDLMEDINPSFFEITVAMAFAYFAFKEVDIAIIEVGLGGRLDSTNVINPEISLITNISLDHTDMLGNSLELIATEKAGIIKEEVPVVIGHSTIETKHVFESKAARLNSPIVFADQVSEVQQKADQANLVIDGMNYVLPEEIADYQVKNIPGVVLVLERIRSKFPKLDSINISDSINNFFLEGGIQGRWQIIGIDPVIICDTAHNIAGVEAVMKQIESMVFTKLWCIWGMVNDKDISMILDIMPRKAEYIFCQASIPRALEANELLIAAGRSGLHGQVIADVNSALDFVKDKAGKNDLIFVGGSTFVVAEINDL